MVIQIALIIIRIMEPMFKMINHQNQIMKHPLKMFIQTKIMLNEALVDMLKTHIYVVDVFQLSWVLL